jgi:cytochrome c peroxidase
MLAPGASRFDRHVEAVLSNSESKSGLSKDEIAGLRLFISADAQCLRCHNGPLFTNHGFHNVGSSAVTDPRPDPGRAAGIPQVLEHEFNCFSPYSDAREPQCLELRFIKKEGEELPGAFKVPTLRNVAETAPYMHDGELGTLDEVLRHYSEPSYGIGHLELSPMNFTNEEIRQLGAFLKTLTSQLEDRQWLTPPKEERTSGSPRDP